MARKKKEIWLTRKGKAATGWDALAGDAVRSRSSGVSKKKPSKSKRKKK